MDAGDPPPKLAKVVADIGQVLVERLYAAVAAVIAFLESLTRVLSPYS
jgi:type III secretion system FlhB-like substrate exporter